MKKAIVNPDIKLLAECPECEEDIDLFDCDDNYNNDEGQLCSKFFGNCLEDLEGMKVRCPECKEFFIIDTYEW